MSDRAVSDTIGYVLAFALVTSTIGVVYATGFVGLDDAQHAEQLQNVERAFDVLDDNLDDIYRRGAPSRATEIQLAGGSLTTGQTSQITVRVVDTANANHNATYVMNPRPVVYADRDDTRIVYVADAVFREQGSQSVMLSRPAWLVSDERVFIPFVVTHRYGSQQVFSGQTTVLVRSIRTSRRVRGHFVPEPGGRADVNVTVTSPRTDAWIRYLEEQGFTASVIDLQNNTASYTYQTDRLYVPEVAVRVDMTS